MICAQCGAEAAGNFCSNCGARIVTGASSADAQAPSPSPPPPIATDATGASLCPVCVVGALHDTEVKELLRTRHELLCDRCGAVLVDRGGQPKHLELRATRNPLEPNWQRYKRQSLTALEWQRIAAGGCSDAEQADADLAEAMVELREGRASLPSPQNCSILLKPEEQPLFVLASISLREPRSVSTGAYGGPAIHVAKGLTIRTGAFRAQSHEILKTIDDGVLVLTSQRLCFAGKLLSIEVGLNKLVSVDAYSDAVVVRRSGKEKVEFFFGLERHTYSFAVQGRHYTEPMSGLIVEYAIEGLLAAAG
jgi:Zn-finger nucleic acid-binding protein